MNSLRFLNEISAFIMVAQESSFARAAQVLGITQPTVSRHVARLEDVLGGPLFERTTRKVELTLLGRALLDDLNGVQERIQDSFEAASRSVMGQRGHLIIAYNSVVMNAYLPRILQQFREEFPKVRIDLKLAHATGQLKLLARGEIDLSFNLSPAEGVAFDSRIISRHRLVAILSSDDPLARKEVLEPSDLEGRSLVVGMDSIWDVFNKPINDFLAVNSISPNISFTGYDFDSISALIHSSGGIGFFVEVDPRMQRRSVVSRRIRTLDVSLPIYFNWRRHTDNAAQWNFIKHVTRCLTD